MLGNNNEWLYDAINYSCMQIYRVAQMKVEHMKCTLAYLQKHISILHQFFLCMLPVAVAWSFSGGVAIC